MLVLGPFLVEKFEKLQAAKIAGYSWNEYHIIPCFLVILAVDARSTRILLVSTSFSICLESSPEVILYTTNFL